MTEAQKIASGVQELITRLRDEGVQAGQAEATRLLREARQRASDIVNQAQAEADSLQRQAQAAIDAERTAAREALRLAVRDTVLRLKAEVIEHFAAQVKRLVTLELQDKNFLRQIILAIAGRVAPEPQDTRAMDLLLANAWFTEAGTTDSTSEPLGHFILGVSQEMLRQGMTLKPAKDDTPGLRLRLVGEEVEIEVTDQAISALLLKHLLPRFRAMIDGMA